MSDQATESPLHPPPHPPMQLLAPPVFPGVFFRAGPTPSGPAVLEQHVHRQHHQHSGHDASSDEPHFVGVPHVHVVSGGGDNDGVGGGRRYSFGRGCLGGRTRLREEREREFTSTCVQGGRQ